MYIYIYIYKGKLLNSPFSKISRIEIVLRFLSKDKFSSSFKEFNNLIFPLLFLFIDFQFREMQCLLSTISSLDLFIIFMYLSIKRRDI